MERLHNSRLQSHTSTRGALCVERLGNSSRGLCSYCRYEELLPITTSELVLAGLYPVQLAGARGKRAVISRHYWCVGIPTISRPELTTTMTSLTRIGPTNPPMVSRWTRAMGVPVMT